MAVLILSWAFEKLLLVSAPSELIMAMQITRINAIITAYSTAVGPSSDCRNV